MSKKLGLPAAAALSIVVFLSTFPGCARTLKCENFVEKNRKCSEEIADFVREMKKKERGDITGEGEISASFKEYLDRVGRETANVFSGPRFQENCESILKEDSSDASKMKDCFKMVDCSDYVKCIMEIKDISQNLL